MTTISPSERAFVAKSWVESFADSDMAKMLTFGGTCPWKGGSTWRAGPGYWRTWNRLVNVLLDRCHMTLIREGDLVAGWMAHETWNDWPVVHYVYVRLGGAFRRHGLARELVGSLAQVPTLYTHRSRAQVRIPEPWRYSLAPLLGVEQDRYAA